MDAHVPLRYEAGEWLYAQDPIDQDKCQFVGNRPKIREKSWRLARKQQLQWHIVVH